MMIYVDAGTTWSKICEISDKPSGFFGKYREYLTKTDKDKKYYIIPSNLLKDCEYRFTAGTGHMSKINLENEENYLNEVISLSKGYLKLCSNDGVVLDLGSRDAKWVKFNQGKFKDLDWNNSCASATGATVEMLLKFYDVNPDELEFTKERYNITCGIFGLEKIMDDIANGESAKIAISKFLHGIAYNSWQFAKKPQSVYLSGGFCENKCFVDSLAQYTGVHKLGRYVLLEGLIYEYERLKHDGKYLQSA